MKEVKFRIWCPLMEKMLDWENVKPLNIELVVTTSIVNIPMQYTGLKDKDGVEIYDGDIIDVTEKYDDFEVYATVAWDDDEAQWCYQKDEHSDNETGGLYDILDKNRTRVIGNIYQNSKLLGY